jgi:hypothetical protein
MQVMALSLHLDIVARATISLNTKTGLEIDGLFL